MYQFKRRKRIRLIFRDYYIGPRVAKRYFFPRKLYAEKSNEPDSLWSIMRLKEKEDNWQKHTYYSYLKELDVDVQSYMMKRLIFRQLDRERALVWGYRRWRGKQRQIRRKKRIKQYYLLLKIRRFSTAKLGKMWLQLKAKQSTITKRIEMLLLKEDLIKLNFRYYRWFNNSLIAKKIAVILDMARHNILAILRSSERVRTRQVYTIPLFKKKEKKDVIEV